MADILYLKIDRNVQAKGSPVHLRDIAGLYCSSKQIENKVRTVPGILQNIRICITGGQRIKDILLRFRIIRMLFSTVYFFNA